MFSKFWHQRHFLGDFIFFIYKMDDLSQWDIYYNKKVVSLFEGLGYVNGVVPSNAASRK